MKRISQIRSWRARPCSPRRSPALAAPTEITDALGRTVTVDLPVKRVAVNFNFEEFTAVAGVDGWSKVVGISRGPWEGWRPLIFNRYKAVIPNLAAMPDIGFTEDNSLSAEKVIGLKPDVLLMSEWGYKAATTQMQQIEGAGIPVVVIDYNAQLLERHLASTRALGKVMGAEARAEELAGLYEREYKDVLARVAKAKAAGAKPKKVYVELGQAGAETVGNTYNNTMWGKIITTLGADNIATGKIPGPWGPLNAEAVIAENPDLILMASSSWVDRPKAVRTGYDIPEAETRASLKPYARAAPAGPISRRSSPATSTPSSTASPARSTTSWRCNTSASGSIRRPSRMSIRSPPSRPITRNTCRSPSAAPGCCR